MIKTPFRLSPALVLLVIAGCGGHGHHDGGRTSAFSANLKLTADEAYNGSTNRTWAATAGTITITRASGNTLDATVDGLTDAPSTAVTSSTAAGSFTVSGTIENATLADA